MAAAQSRLDAPTASRTAEENSSSIAGFKHLSGKTCLVIEHLLP
jgi:hypothetical protein